MELLRRGLPSLKSIAAIVFAFAAAFSSAGLVQRDVVLEGESVEVEEAVSRSRPDPHSLRKSAQARTSVAAASQSNHLVLPAIQCPISYYAECTLRSGVGCPLLI